MYKRQSKDYMAAMRKYSGVKVMQIIGEIRYCDAKSKGVGNPSLEDGDLLLSLIHIYFLGSIYPFDGCIDNDSL